MKRCVALIAALPREVSALVKGWEHWQPQENVHLYSNGAALVSCAGMGAARADVALNAAVNAMDVSRVISVGLAGACNPALRVGDVVRAGRVIDFWDGDSFTDSRYSQVVVSMDRVASVREKAELHEKYGADAVDMEAAEVAYMAETLGLEFSSVKVISDAADFELDDIAKFVTAGGQFREAAFVFHAALRPAMWRKMITLGRNSSVALEALTKELRRELDLYEKGL